MKTKMYVPDHAKQGMKESIPIAEPHQKKVVKGCENATFDYANHQNPTANQKELNLRGYEDFCEILAFHLEKQKKDKEQAKVSGIDLENQHLNKEQVIELKCEQNSSAKHFAFEKGKKHKGEADD